MAAMIDASVLIHLIHGNPIVNERMEELIEDEGPVYINGLSYYEVKCGFRQDRFRAQAERFRAFLSMNHLYLLDTVSVFDRASEIFAELASRGKPIKHADIIHAACAMEGNHLLIGCDRHFDEVKGLRYKDWDPDGTLKDPRKAKAEDTD